MSHVIEANALIRRQNHLVGSARRPGSPRRGSCRVRIADPSGFE